MQLTLARERRIIRIGQKLGSGGEGSVFAVEESSKSVAKLYSLPPDPQKIVKLSAMAEGAIPSLLKIAAWPTDLLMDGKGAVRGFVMPRVTARRDIHELYSPKSRAEAFPEADFSFIVHVAANIARSFAVVHDQGHVIGDVNHGNLLVGLDGTVMLIDCDSFQIRNGVQVVTCDVGVPLFTPPELQGRPFRGLVRSPNHDLFGLAVLLFHLLYMGRHPFAGRFLGRGDMPIERAIAEYRFAYGPDGPASGMERPPGTIPIETLGTEIAQLFVRAFGRVGTNEGRPPARTWIARLDQLKRELQKCSQAGWHYYPRWLGSCPWCQLETQTGARLFGQRIAAFARAGTVDLSAIWRSITAVPDPGPDPQLPSDRLWNPPPGVKLPSPLPRKIRTALAWALIGMGFVSCTWSPENRGIVPAIVLYVLAWAMWPKVSTEKRIAVQREFSEAQAKWDELLARWVREASQKTFVEKRQQLEEARSELADLPNERRRRIAKLEAEREMHQKHRYLDRFLIDRGSIRGIGPGRTAMLASYGIETADDVVRGTVLGIPGFGETLTAELLRWRNSHERNFRFNPNEPIDPKDIQALDQELSAKQQKLLAMIQQGPTKLQHFRQEIVGGRTRLMPILELAWTQLKIAEAERNAL